MMLVFGFFIYMAMTWGVIELVHGRTLTTFGKVIFSPFIPGALIIVGVGVAIDAVLGR